MSEPRPESDSVSQGRLDELPAEVVLKGVTRRRVDGTKLTLMHYSFGPDATRGLHSHVEEQVMMVVHWVSLYTCLTRPVPCRQVGTA